MRSPIIAAALAVGLLVGVLVPAAGAPTPCSIALSTGTTALEASVTSDSPDAVQLQLNFTVTKPDAARAVAMFAASVDLGWVATPSPSSVTITNQRAGILVVTIVVPAASKPTTVGIARVEASMTAGGVQCQGGSVDGITITPLPYFNSVAGHLTPTNVTLKGGAAVVTVALGAKANVPVSLALEYAGPAGVSFVGPASVSFAVNDAGVMNGTATVQLHAVDLPAGTYQFTVRVHGTASPDLSQEATLNAPLVAPQPPDIVASAAPFLPLAIVAAIAAGVAVWWKRRA